MQQAQDPRREAASLRRVQGAKTQVRRVSRLRSVVFPLRQEADQVRCCRRAADEGRRERRRPITLSIARGRLPVRGSPPYESAA